MKLARGLHPRLLAIVASMLFLSGLVLLLAATTATMPMVAQGMHELFMALLSQGEQARCEASPETWGVTTAQGIRVYSYDRHTRRSYNPAAPPLDADIADKLEASEQGRAMRLVSYPEYLVRDREVGGILAFHAADAGPCAVMQFTWPLRLEIRLRTLAVPLLIVLMLCIGVVALIISRGTLGPLLERVARLRAMADEVGKEGAALEPAFHHGDELDQIARVLVEAHARIRDDAEALAEQRRALERHIREVSHDLRTPMTALGLALEELAARPEEPRAQEAVAAAIGELQYMTSLIENLRLGTELRDPQRELRRLRVDLVELSEQVIRRQRMIARQRHIQLNLAHPDAALAIEGDPTMITQALTNVIQNAITYNDPGGHVAVLLEQPAPGQTFCIRIIDDGPGVDAAALSHLSAPTFRTDAARSRRPEGDGLGLAIVRAVCERHGWSLELSANTPRGLCVTIVGPLAAPARH